MYYYNPYYYNPYYQNGLNGQQQLSKSVEPPSLPRETGEYRAGTTFFFDEWDRQGFEKHLNIGPRTVNSMSKVFVSISELKNGRPHMGAASMQVHNVVPHDNGWVIVRGHIGWDRDLPFRLSVVVF